MLDDRRKSWLVGLGTTFGVILLCLLLLWLLFFRMRVYTNDAYVEGNQIILTPLQEGFVTAIHTDDTFYVEEGQLLVELDRTDREIALAARRHELGEKVRTICQLFHELFALRSEIEVRKAALIQSAQDYLHRSAVIDQSGVSLEDYEHARAAFREAFYQLRKSESLYERTLAEVQGSSISSHPLVERVKEQVRQAAVDLYRCNIYAPASGLAAQRTIQVGMWVKAGAPLLTIIPLDQIWVNANYKETQVKHMRIGQSARVVSDLYGQSVVYEGRVVGLPGGAGNAFSLLPPENLSGNWIKIVQRLPVRIALDPEALLHHPLRIGLSMEVTVDLTGEGRLVPRPNEPAPCYDTAIFAFEEQGDEEMIAETIDQNLDPMLALYRDKALEVERYIKFDLSEIQELKNLPIHSSWSEIDDLRCQ